MLHPVIEGWGDEVTPFRHPVVAAVVEWQEGAPPFVRLTQIGEATRAR
jgi:hypothetical protein